MWGGEGLSLPWPRAICPEPTGAGTPGCPLLATRSVVLSFWTCDKHAELGACPVTGPSVLLSPHLWDHLWGQKSRARCPLLSPCTWEGRLTWQIGLGRCGKGPWGAQVSWMSLCPLACGQGHHSVLRREAEK